MKEKHELLKYAYDNYPPGTKFTGVGSKMEFTSVGRFKFYEYTGEFCTDINIVSEGKGSVFQNGVWAEIVKDDPLKVDKIAVRVNNERELKVLMEHYNSLGWISDSKEAPDIIMKFNKFLPCLTWAYHDRFFALTFMYVKYGYEIIDFDFFCAQKGLTLPKFIMKSEDGVDLYDGDDYIPIYLHVDTWVLESDELRPISLDHSSVISPGTCKAFSTKEAAEKWIENENKPKIVQLFHGMEAYVYVNKIQIKDADKVVTDLSMSDIEDVAHACGYAWFKNDKSPIGKNTSI